MVATEGGALASAGVISAMRDQPFPLTTLLTPNAPGAEALTGMPVRNRLKAARAGTELLASGCRAVLIKGGHLVGDAFAAYRRGEPMWRERTLQAEVAHV
jgi:hydroxymethylpyrimidine/phosphomethylpyrimidine kinase